MNSASYQAFILLLFFSMSCGSALKENPIPNSVPTFVTKISGAKTSVELYRKSVSWGERGNWDLALKSIEEALEKEPDEPEFIWQYVRVLYHSGQLEETVAVSKRAIENEHYHPDVFYYQSKAYMSLGQMEEAAKSMKYLTVEDPLLLAGYHIFNGDTTSGTIFLEKALEGDQRIEALNNLIAISKQRNQNEAELKWMLMLPEMSKSNEIRYVQLIEQTQGCDSALHVIEQHKLNVDYTSALYPVLVSCLRETNQTLLLDSLIEITLQEDPNNRQAKMVKVEILESKRMYANALKLVDEIVASDSTDENAAQMREKIVGKIVSLQKQQEVRRQNAEIQLIEPKKPEN